MAEDLEIVEGGADLLDELRPLWLALRDHHGAVAPERGPVRDDDGSWGRRRADYERWLADDAFVLLVRDPGGGPALAYAFVRRLTAQAPTWPDARVLEVETLSVLEAARGRGLGAALLDRIRAIADAEGFDALQLTAVAQNEDALRFYAREGFAPAYVVLRDSRGRP